MSSYVSKYTGPAIDAALDELAALGDNIRATLLTGLSTATNAAITATDNVLSALGKLQAQITAHVGLTSTAHGATSTKETANSLVSRDTSGNILDITQRFYYTTGAVDVLATIEAAKKPGLYLFDYNATNTPATATANWLIDVSCAIYTSNTSYYATLICYDLTLASNFWIGTIYNNAVFTGWKSMALNTLGTPLPAATGTMTATMDGSYKAITPTGACTFNAAVGVAGQRCAFVITTSGTTSYTLTWGTNFKTTGTLATGAVSGKKFVVEFVYDGGYWIETGRTTAM